MVVIDMAGTHARVAWIDVCALYPWFLSRGSAHHVRVVGCASSARGIWSSADLCARGAGLLSAAIHRGVVGVTQARAGRGRAGEPWYEVHTARH